MAEKELTEQEKYLQAEAEAEAHNETLPEAPAGRRPRKSKAQKNVVPYFPIPEGHEDESDAWHHAFCHAMSMRYTAEKGAILYADARQYDDNHVEGTIADG